MTVIVIAKAPQPGRSKTRLSPPLTPAAAAQLAEASLRDTLSCVARVPAERRVLALEGEPGPWLPAGFQIVPQRGAGLDERLAAAFEDVGGPAVLIGMDTPQLSPALLRLALTELEEADAVVGPALDGGYWAIGLREPRRELFEGVPMSSDDTCRAQLGRLAEHGLSVTLLPPLRDIDVFEDARAVARLAPRSHFATALRAAA
ncbi:MAG TPA: TIGR04282 family arsenosugar biosynthesis glycosyltransferase [Thermoleophilaceae bacterium]|nr:TIGR04282 family arsenosugar biosynthesis glycosyltransferase [Thermoleophilaceae bacterium]